MCAFKATLNESDTSKAVLKSMYEVSWLAKNDKPVFPFQTPAPI